MVVIIERKGQTLILDCDYTTIKTLEDAANNGWQVVGYVRKAK